MADCCGCDINVQALQERRSGVRVTTERLLLARQPP